MKAKLPKKVFSLICPCSSFQHPAGKN